MPLYGVPLMKLPVWHTHQKQTADALVWRTTDDAPRVTYAPEESEHSSSCTDA